MTRANRGSFDFRRDPAFRGSAVIFFVVEVVGIAEALVDSYAIAENLLVFAVPAVFAAVVNFLLLKRRDRDPR